MDEQRRTSEQAAEDVFRGLPQPLQSPLTVEGRIEQVGKMASGLRTAREGWRKTVVRLGIVLLVLFGLVILALVIFG